jgi:hypothetical protein
MYIGTSLGKCLRSLLLSEVSEADVLLIITRTKAKDLEQFLFVVKEYYEGSNYSSRHPEEYDLAVKPWNEVEELATQLYHGGKIHQPRNFAVLGGQFIHPDLSNDVWIEVSPKSRNTTPAVVQAYEHYKLLDSLTKDHS